MLLLLLFQHFCGAIKNATGGRQLRQLQLATTERTACNVGCNSRWQDRVGEIEISIWKMHYAINVAKSNEPKSMLPHLVASSGALSEALINLHSRLPLLHCPVASSIILPQIDYYNC